MKAADIIIAALGALVGLAYSLWQALVAAPAAVAVRPQLAEVGLVTAFATGHGFDWLFYHHPIAGSVAATAGAAILAFLAALTA